MLIKPSSKKSAAYDPAKIEQKWQKKWASSKLYKTKEDTGKDLPAGRHGKFYVLDMFPYPSGEGLHVGHPKGYIATDVISRMNRMQGRNVLHPMGFDAFGLPAENYALKTKTNPEIAVKKNVAHYKEQLDLLGFDYDWSREVNTTDPEYYRWTQWIFLQLFKKGLAYESYEPVNWCPTDKTVLANEDVENGRCERCGTPVEKKPMRQWVLRITDYADRLLKDLDGKYEPLFWDNSEVSRPKPDLPFEEREAIIAVVEHWSEDKFIALKWKQVAWKTLLTGGVEKGQTPEEAAEREITEETGYKNLELVANLGREHAKFYHVPKKVNRFGHFTILHFKLKNNERNDVTADEQAKHEVVWVPRSEMMDYLGPEGQKYAFQLLLDKANGLVPEPLLDWPESIKEAQRNWIGRSEGAEIDFGLVLTKNNPRFVILHGYTGRADKNFIPWLKKELEKRGYEVETPQMPNTDHPKESEQVEYVLNNCKLDANTVVIGHSLGGVVAMKAIMKFNRPISGLVLVAPAVEPGFRTGKERPFWKTFTWDFDYAQVKELTGGKIAILSDLKEKDRVSYLKFLANKLSALLIETTARREHFCALQEPAILDCVTPSIPVFTTRSDTLFGVTYLVLAPEHPWIKELLSRLENKAEIEAYIEKAQKETEIERTDAKKEKTGVELKGLKAVNPANGEEVPIWVADYVLADYGTGAVMAVPAHDERDADFAKKYKLPVREIELGDKAEMIRKFGREVTKYKLRDWVFSRQRYWGEPIPLIRCEKCGVVPVPEKDLPVKLPKVKSYEPTGTGESPLAAISKWVNVKCPKCKGPAKRETNTMPQWAGSCWYYLRYEDPKNKKALVDPKKEKYWSPVDLYVGGAEHATRHLIYARFWHKFLNDIGVVSTSEPFTKLQSVGLIMGEDGRKMSKRFGNVVNPDEIVKQFGADTLRIYEMFMGPFDQAIPWSTESIVGSRRFIERVWRLSERAAKRQQAEDKTSVSEAVNHILHKTIKKVTDDITAMRFNTAISTLMIAVNELEKCESLSHEQFETLLKLLAPFAPHVTEELWRSLGNKQSIHTSEWPKYDPSDAIEKEANIIVQVNGKMRASFKASIDATEEQLKATALDLSDTKKWLEGKSVKKVIVVKGKLVSIVVG